MSFRAATVALICLGLGGYFAYHLALGAHGLETRARLQTRITTLQGELAGLEAVRAKLERNVSLLRAEHLDPDMLDERARAILNFAHPNDLVVVDPKEAPPPRR